MGQRPQAATGVARTAPDASSIIERVARTAPDAFSIIE
jgi:hypothetical protein